MRNYVIRVLATTMRRGRAGAQPARRARLLVDGSCGAKHVVGKATSHHPGYREGTPAGDGVFETIPGIAPPSLAVAPCGARITVRESSDVFDKPLRDRCAARRMRSYS